MTDDGNSVAGWKAVFPALRHDIDDISITLENLLFPQPLAISAFEDKDEDHWRIELLFENKPDPKEIAQLISNTTVEDITVSPLQQENWVEKSLENLKPVRAGRFYVHGSHNEPTDQPSDIPLLINAGQAFGTGHHGTTKGCLIAIENHLKKRQVTNALDLGCGTGILAVGIAKVSAARITASDIDPIAIEVAQEVATANDCHPRIQFIIGPGTNAPGVRDNAPYDLVVANILAEPLRQMAKDIFPLITPGGTAVISGLLATQERSVLSVYTDLGFRLIDRIPLEEWMTLVIER